MKKKTIILQLIFTIIVGVTLFFGIANNPSFNIYDLCASLSSEFIGWILAVTIFQYYFDVKMAARKNIQNKVDNSFSVADEIIKLRNLMDTGIITQEEFENIKTRVITK